jgi:glucosamine-6-phosphate deaminase
LDLLTDHGPSSRLNVEVFNHLNRTITGWPGGKPGSGMMSPEMHTPNTPAPIREPLLYSTPGGRIFPKKILIFSPHPDDDVISMGGTLRRLVEQGHDVHVAYQTSGNIAVRDDDAQRFANFATEYSKLFNIPNLSQISDIESKVESFMSTKRAAHPDSSEIQKIKGLIRRTEARVFI